MRQEVLDYIKTLNLGGFKLSTEAPFDAGGNSLYIKNPKTIYVDFAQTTSTPFIIALNGLNISNETTTISVYFSTDAKLVPSNFETITNLIKSAKDILSIKGVNTREVDSSTVYQGDLIISQIDLRYIKLT